MALVTVQRSPSPSNSPESDVGDSIQDFTDSSRSPLRQRRSKSALKKLRKLFNTIRFVSKLRFSESYFAVKGAALILPQSECQRSITKGTHGGDIQNHLKSMFCILRPQDTIKVAVKLESAYSGRNRYLAVVSTNGRQDTEESIILGIDCNERATAGLVLPVWADTKIRLDGDGGFIIDSVDQHHIFKPVSVQAMWSGLQSLHKVCETARQHTYYPNGLTHTWVGYYVSRIESDRTCLNEWHTMEDIESHRPDSPHVLQERDPQRTSIEKLIKANLKDVMMTVDLEEVTSKELREKLEVKLSMSLKEYRQYIDSEMIIILRQMDSASMILDYLYLGSEWNASNLEELKANGIGFILNITREIDNFFPGIFEYLNIRVYDVDESDLLRFWEKTYKFICKARNAGSKCLVHCKMGVSRSASTVIAFIMKEFGWDLETAKQFVRQKRTCILPNAGFVQQLQTYQGILDASKQRHNSLWRSKSENNLKNLSVPSQEEETLSDVCISPRCGDIEFDQYRPRSWSPDNITAELLLKGSKCDQSSKDSKLDKFEMDVEISSRSADSTDDVFPDVPSPVHITHHAVPSFSLYKSSEKIDSSDTSSGSDNEEDAGGDTDDSSISLSDVNSNSESSDADSDSSGEGISGCYEISAVQSALLQSAAVQSSFPDYAFKDFKHIEGSKSAFRIVKKKGSTNKDGQKSKSKQEMDSKMEASRTGSTEVEANKITDSSTTQNKTAPIGIAMRRIHKPGVETKRVQSLPNLSALKDRTGSSGDLQVPPNTPVFCSLKPDASWIKPIPISPETEPLSKAPAEQHDEDDSDSSASIPVTDSDISSENSDSDDSEEPCDAHPSKLNENVKFHLYSSSESIESDKFVLAPPSAETIPERDRLSVVQYEKESIPWSPGTVRRHKQALESQSDSKESINQLGRSSVSSDSTSSRPGSLHDSKEKLFLDPALSKQLSVSSGSEIALDTPPMFHAKPVVVDPVVKPKLLSKTDTLSSGNSSDSGKKTVPITATRRPRPKSTGDVSDKRTSTLSLSQEKVSDIEVFSSSEIQESSESKKSVYEVEEIPLRPGLVKKTTQEIEEKYGSVSYSVSALSLAAKRLGLDISSTTAAKFVQRSSSLRVKRVTPRVDISDLRRKTCSPVLKASTSPVKEVVGLLENLKPSASAPGLATIYGGGKSPPKSSKSPKLVRKGKSDQGSESVILQKEMDGNEKKDQTKLPQDKSLDIPVFDVVKSTAPSQERKLSPLIARKSLELEASAQRKKQPLIQSTDISCDEETLPKTSDDTPLTSAPKSDDSCSQSKEEDVPVDGSPGVPAGTVRKTKEEIEKKYGPGVSNSETTTIPKEGSKNTETEITDKTECDDLKVELPPQYKEENIPWTVGTVKLHTEALESLQSSANSTPMLSRSDSSASTGAREERRENRMNKETLKLIRAVGKKLCGSPESEEQRVFMPRRVKQVIQEIEAKTGIKRGVRKQQMITENPEHALETPLVVKESGRKFLPADKTKKKRHFHSHGKPSTATVARSKSLKEISTTPPVSSSTVGRSTSFKENLYTPRKYSVEKKRVSPVSVEDGDNTMATDAAASDGIEYIQDYSVKNLVGKFEGDKDTDEEERKKTTDSDVLDMLKLSPSKDVTIIEKTDEQEVKPKKEVKLTTRTKTLSLSEDVSSKSGESTHLKPLQTEKVEATRTVSPSLLTSGALNEMEDFASNQKLQHGKSHPLTRLAEKQNLHKNPFYSTM